MKLVIQKSSTVDKDFIEWLLQKIKYLLFVKANPKKLSKLNSVFIETNPLNLSKQTISRVDLSAAVISAITSFTYRELKSQYVFYIPDNLCLSRSKIKVSTLCRFVNYGDINTKGYPLFSEVLNHVKANLSYYYNEYLYEYL